MNSGPSCRSCVWKNGYSIHFTDAGRFPYDSNTVSRPLPSTEIVTSIRSLKPGSGTYDSTHRTYVELGIFYTQLDSVSGVPHPIGDVNHIFIVNRRCFERPDSISNTSTRGRKMDTLAEVRTIEVKLNLPHPDTTAYNFIRIRERAVDTTRLPLSSGPRTALDTIINADSIFALTLGPGRAALLEITYAPPTESILLGDLRFSSQRKILYDGRKYHAVFHRWNPADITGFLDTIFYRRSLPVDSSLGYAGIRWEPKEYAVSVCNLGGINRTRYENRFPSMTLRSFNGDTVVTVVWTCHPYDSAHGSTFEREIVARNIRTSGTGDATPQPTIEIVDWHKGTNPTEWGMPVICRADAGEFIAWSDSLKGIVARFRARGHGSTWWLNTSPVYSPIDTVSKDMTNSTGHAGQFPTLPTFAHIASQDSICGIAWQQGTVVSPFTEIRHRVLIHDSTAGTGLRVRHVTAAINDVSLSGSGNFTHPSMDQFQDFWQEQQNVVTWEEHSGQFHRIHMRSVYIDTRDSMGWDTTGGDTLHNIQHDVVDTSFVWGWAQHVAAKTTAAQHSMWPNIAALNQRASRYWADHDTTTANIVYQVGPTTGEPVMYRAIAQWADGVFKRADRYTWGGTYPVGSASTERQEPRYAALHRKHSSGSDTLGYTSREFFARERPTGYMADGRAVVLRISEPLRTSITLGLTDVWLANAAGAESVPFVPRGSTRIRIDSLRQVHDLFRTRNFHTSDSTTIGCSISGMFTGDSSVGAGTTVSGVVELVDSATGNVVHQLDSFAISAAEQSYDISVEPTLDLLSGTYYVRMRIASPALPDDEAMGDSRYPIAEVSQFVDNASFGKLRRLDNRPQATARIAASPNPFSGVADVRFSISTPGNVSVRVHDQRGREVARLIDNAWMEAGRYAVTFERMDLEPGTYLIELRSGDARAVTKVVLVR